MDFTICHGFPWIFPSKLPTKPVEPGPDDLARFFVRLRKAGRMDPADWGDADASLMGPNGPSFIGKVFRDPMSAKVL